MNLLFRLFILLVIPCLVIAEQGQAPLKLGVLAYRPKAQVMVQWQPVANYLQTSLERPVKLTVYDHAEISTAVEQHSVDMVITTANQFILLQHKAGLSSPLATLVLHKEPNHLSSYGSTILTRADRSDIGSLADLPGKRIAVVSQEAFAGYQMPAFELVEAGIPLPTQEELLLTGQPQDRVIQALLEGRADVGFVRAGVLESLAQEGKLDPSQVKVINRQEMPDFPYVVSTRLYPEWPVAVMPHIDKGFASRLAATLYLMPHEVSKSTRFNLYGFGIPANYDVVEELLRRLRLPPFDQVPEFSLLDLWHRYTWWLLALVGLLLLLSMSSFSLVVMVRRSHRSLDELKQMAKKEKMILASLAEGVYGIDPQGRCIFINPRALSILGLTEEEVIGKDAHALFHTHKEDDSPHLMENCPIMQALRDDNKRELEDIYMHKDGRKIPVWTGVSVMRHSDRILGAVVVFQDISERKQAEAALRQSEARHRQIIATSREGIWVLGLDKTTIFVNARMVEMLGYREEELVGRPMDDFMFEEDLPNHKKKMEARQQGVSESYERRFRRKDNQTIWSLVSATPTYDEEHRFNGSFAMFTDITERKRDEEVNATRLHLVQFSLTHSLDELLEETLNQVEKLTGSLISFYHFLGDDQENLTLQAWSTRTKTKFCKAQEHEMHYLIAQAGVWADCVRQRKAVIHNDYASLPHRKGLPEKHAEVVRELVAPVFRGDKIAAILGIGNKPTNYTQKDVEVVLLIADLSREIAERMQIESELDRYHYHLEETVNKRTEELRLARDAAEAASKAKSAFLANMSHELRTPLNAILGFSQLMRLNSDLNESQREALDIINNSGKHLLKLINDVLEIAKIEAGKVQLAITTFDLYELVREVADMMQLKAEQKGLYLQLDQSSEFPRYIKADEARLRQVLVNLVSNAVKFTDKGGVTIRLEVKESIHHHLQIDVKDTGPGISKTDQQRLFKPFVQLPTQATEGGTGLGLSIVRQFVQLMDGCVTVESSPNKGTLFRVELPLDEAEEMEVMHLGNEILGEIAGLEPGQPIYRILIAEDQQESQLLLSKLMTELGLEVKNANNGEQCVQLFKTWKPDLIWMDRRMPVMSGEEAARHIRQLPGGDKVKIIAVTASAFKEEHMKMVAAGMDSVVRKPYHFNEIYSSLAQQLGLRYIYATAEQPSQMLEEERLAALPEALRMELQETLESLESNAIEAAIQKVADQDAELAKHLSKLAEGLNYPVILDALMKVKR